MSIFKQLSDGYRLRCNRHNASGKTRCTHKIKLPFPGFQLHRASDPLAAIAFNLPIPFSYSKMHYAKETVSLALYLSIFIAIPATQVSRILSDLCNLHPAHDTITRWTHKGVVGLHKHLGPLSVPYSPRKKLYADETQFKQHGHKRWLWLTKESRFDSLQSWFLSPRRATEYARSTFTIAFQHSPTLKNATIITDGLWSYPCALADLDFAVVKNHYRYLGFFEDPLHNNNRLERHWSTLKVKARPFRGFKSERGLWCFITGQIYLHNYFQPNNRLQGLTPAEAAGVKLPYCHSRWKLLTKFF
jgi:transposase-like protein